MIAGTPASTGEDSAEDTAVIGRISAILLEAVTALAAAGELDAACRLAGKACVALRTAAPRTAHRFNALLHRLAAKLPP